MSYYRIKCVHCLANIKSNDVLFKLDTECLENGYEEYNIQDDIDTDKTSEYSEIGAAVMQMGNDSTANYDSFSDAEIMVTGSNLKKYTDDCRPICCDAVKLPENVFDSEMVYNGDLVTGYKVKGLKIRSKKYNGRLVKRFCPKCKKPLLKESGQLPVIVVAMIGHSTAGKTVFLTMQSFANSHNKLNNVVDHGKILINTLQSHLHTTEKDIVDQAASVFERTGEFPSTTQEIPLPHCLLVNYREFEDGSSKRFKSDSTTSCIICYRDAIGELFTKDDRATDDRSKTISDICRQADALMVLTDPFSLSVTRRNVVTGNLQMNNDDLKTMISLLMEIFNNITAAVDKPTVCLMTKTDALFNYASQLDLDTTDRINTDDSSAYFFGKDKNWAEKVFEQLQKSTKRILEKLDSDGQWVENLETNFVDNTAFLPLSSIGKKVKILDLEFRTDTSDNAEIRSVKKIVTPENWSAFRSEFEGINSGEIDKWNALVEKINRQQVPYNEVDPRFIELPLIYLLSLFQMIPPITDVNYAVSREENFKEWSEKCTMTTENNSEDFRNGERPKYNRNVSHGIIGTIGGLFGRGRK